MAPRPATGMRRWAPVVVAVVAMVLGAIAVLSWVLQPSSGSPMLLVEVAGDVTISPADGEPRRARVGQAVRAGEEVRAGPGSSSAVLTVGPDVSLSLEPGSSMKVQSVRPDRVEVELPRGRVRAKIDRGGPAVRIANEGRGVESSEGEVDVVVSESGVLAVDVTAGSARTFGFDGAGELASGGRVTVLPDGASAHGPIPDDVLLDVAWPEEDRTRAEALEVTGSTSPGAAVTLRAGGSAVAVLADRRGRFRARVPLAEGEHPLVVESIDPFGRRVSDEVMLVVDRTPPTLRGGGVTERPP